MSRPSRIEVSRLGAPLSLSVLTNQEHTMSDLTHCPAWRALAEHADQIRYLRNHPSIFTWVLASDLLPHPDLERRYRTLLAELDTTRPPLVSCLRWSRCALAEDYGRALCIRWR